MEVINFDIPSAMSVTRWRGIVLVCHAIDMKGQPDMLDDLLYCYISSSGSLIN